MSGNGHLNLSDGLIVFGTYSSTNHPRVQVLIEGLRQHNIVVEEINVPIEAEPRLRARSITSLATVARTIWQYLRAALRLATLRFQTNPSAQVVLIPYLGLTDTVLARALFPTRFLVWDDLAPVSQTLEDRSLGGPGLSFLVRRIEGLSIRCSNLVLYDTAEQMRSMAFVRPRHQKAAIPVGASSVWHRSAESASSDFSQSYTALSVIYFGTYVPLHGAEIFGQAIAEVLARGASLEVTLIGDGTGRQSVEAALEAFAESVKWHDWVDAPALAQMVSSSDLSLGIFGTSRKALQVVPNKAYQSIAAGTPIITSLSQAQMQALGEAALYVTPGDATELADLLLALTSNRTPLKTARQKALAVRTSYTPKAIASELTEAIRLISS